MYGCFTASTNAYRTVYVSEQPYEMDFTESLRVKGCSFKAEHQWASQSISAQSVATQVINRPGCDYKVGGRKTRPFMFSLNAVSLEGLIVIFMQ